MHDFKNCCFLIPYRKAGNEDREINLLHVLRFLNTFITTNVIIVEQIDLKVGEPKTLSIIEKLNFTNLNVKYKIYNDKGGFHKTKLYNMGLTETTEDIVIPYDVDVLIPIEQLIKARQLLMDGFDYCFPFNENYIEIPKSLQEERNKLLTNFDFHLYTEGIKGIHDKNEKLHFRKRPPGIIRGCPPGGCIFIKRNVYIDCGMENEDFCGYGPEDAERKQRLHLFGYKQGTVEGNLYHIEHEYEADNRRITTPNNKLLNLKLQGMDTQALMQYYKNKNYKQKYGINI
jgi:predicted glycosyltransferase involved in capsule biosynthesis